MQTYVIDDTKVKRLMLDKWGTVEQKMLAEKAGITEQTIVRLLQGYGFTSDTLFKLCKALECTPNEVLKVIPKAAAPVAMAA